jgi:hypothetical protein
VIDKGSPWQIQRIRNNHPDSEKSGNTFVENPQLIILIGNGDDERQQINVMIIAERNFVMILHHLDR